MDEYKWLSKDLGAFKKVKIEMRALLNRPLLITLIWLDSCGTQGVWAAACLSDDRERRVFLFFKLYLNATKFVLLSVFTLKGTFCPRICSKSRLKSAKSPYPVDVRRSKTSLLKLPMWEWPPVEYGLWDWQGSSEVLTARTFRVLWRIDTIIFSKSNKPPSPQFALPQTCLR